MSETHSTNDTAQRRPLCTSTRQYISRLKLIIVDDTTDVNEADKCAQDLRIRSWTPRPSPLGEACYIVPME